MAASWGGLRWVAVRVPGRRLAGRVVCVHPRDDFGRPWLCLWPRVSLSIYLSGGGAVGAVGPRSEIYLSIYLSIGETHYSDTPSDARAARALFGGDVHAGRAPRDCGVHEAL